MFNSVLSALYRHTKKNLTASVVNLTGLSLSLAALIVISCYIHRELRYDKHHAHYDRIFRVNEIIETGSYCENSSSLPFPMGEVLATDNSDIIEEFVRIFDFQTPTKAFRLENQELFNESNVYYADSNLFQFFNFNILASNPSELLNKPFKMVISQRLAKKWFGDDQAIGKSVLLAGQEKFRVEITGVFENAGPSHFQPEGILSMATALAIAPGMAKNWVWNPVWTYVKLKPAANQNMLQDRLPALVKKHEIPQLQDMVKLTLISVSDIHLHSHLEFEMGVNSDMAYVYILISCAFFLLCVAIFNFINLYAVTLMNRTKEAAVRRVAGAHTFNIFKQYLLETMLYVSGGFVAGLLLVFLTRNWLNSYIGMELSTDLPGQPEMIIWFILMWIMIACITAIYPAWLLSRYPIIALAKGEIKFSKGGRLLKKTLVNAQFTIAVVVFVFAIASRKQFEYMIERENGYDNRNVITMYMGGTTLPFDFETFRNSLLANPGIASVSMMNEIVGINNNNHEYRFGEMTGDEFRYIPALVVDEHFAKTLGLKVIAGRDYDPDRKLEDSLSIVVNRSMIKHLGYDDPEKAIGKRCASLSGNEVIIGVVEDFNNKSVHHPVGPFVLDIESRNQYNHYIFAKYAVVKFNGAPDQVISHLKKVWNEMVTTKAFDYAFLNDLHKDMYHREFAMSRLLFLFTVLVILIACSGLFAISRIIAGMKAKELAVRKAIGASGIQIVKLSVAEHLWILLISLLIGLPASYLIVQKWMNSFSYHIHISAGMLIMSGLVIALVSMIALLPVAFKSARDNSFVALRS